MNRIIKFRCWFAGKMYIGIPSIAFNSSGVRLVNLNHDDEDFYNTPDTWTGEDDYVLMQLTGLKDISGKEIFEGDIIDAWVSRWPDRKTRGIVIWNEHCAAFQLQYEGAFGNTPTDFIHQWHFYEIIGNKFEQGENN